MNSKEAFAAKRFSAFYLKLVMAPYKAPTCNESAFARGIVEEEALELRGRNQARQADSAGHLSDQFAVKEYESAFGGFIGEIKRQAVAIRHIADTAPTRASGLASSSATIILSTESP